VVSLAKGRLERGFPNSYEKPKVKLKGTEDLETQYLGMARESYHPGQNL